MRRKLLIGLFVLTASAVLFAQPITRALSQVFTIDGTAAAPSIAFANNPTTGFYNIGPGQVAVATAGVGYVGFFSDTLQVKSTEVLGWATSTLNTVTDTKIGKIAAGVPGSSLVGAGTQTGGFPVSIFTSTTSASNASTTETDLMTYTMPAGTMNVNGQKVRITTWGTFANNANSKSVRVYFGSTLVGSRVGDVSANIPWRVSVIVVRSGAATQVGFGENTNSGSGNALAVTSPTETLANALTLKVTGQSATAGGDVTALGMFIEWIP